MGSEKRKMLIVLSFVILLNFISTGKVFAQPKEIKIVITAAFVSEKGMQIYNDMTAWLSKKLGWNVKVVSGLSYTEADEMLENGLIQIGGVCGLPYVHSVAENKYELLAIPVMSMKKGTWPDAPGYEDVPGKYFSYTIVHKDSPLKSWADLKGKKYAFNDMNSNSGYNMPRYKLVQLGAKSWNEYFSKVIVSGSHEESIRLVSNKVVDASSVDSLVLDYDRHIGDESAKNVKIIEVLHPGGAGTPPMVISKKADPSIKDKLTDALVNMNKDPEGLKVLEKALMLRFDPPNDSNYDDIRKMEKEAIDAGFKDFE